MVGMSDNEMLGKISSLQVLGVDTRMKSMSLLGKLDGHDALILAEKLPFVPENAIASLKDWETELIDGNDIYYRFLCVPPREKDTKITIIWPATEKHIKKYSFPEKIIITESYEAYQTIVAPYIESIPRERLAWVHNILDGKAESDRIIFQDNDPVDGFILLPGISWV